MKNNNKEAKINPLNIRIDKLYNKMLNQTKD